MPATRPECRRDPDERRRSLKKQLRTMELSTLCSARRDKERLEAMRAGWPAGCGRRSAEWLAMLERWQRSHAESLEVAGAAYLMGVNNTSARRRLEYLRAQGWVMRIGTRPRRYRLVVERRVTDTAG